MSKTLTLALGLVVTLALAVAASAQDQGKEKQHRHEGPRPQSGFDRVEGMLRGLSLTDDQKTKIAEIKKEYEPKFKEATEKLDGILTPEQKKARDEAVKEAWKAGKRGKDVMEAGRAAAKATDEQKTKLDAAWKTMADLGKECRDKVLSVLTAEQKEQLKKRRENMRQRKPEVN